MTADRWWVRLAARWLARIDGVSGQMKLGFQGLTAVSAVLGVVKYYGYQRYAPAFIGAMTAGLLVYTYLYTEGGVWNQMSRDRADLSTNYLGPSGRMMAELNAKTFVATMQGEPLSKEQERAAEEQADSDFMKYRDGIDLEDYDNDD